ncbi:MAG: hypothetical protein GVY16_10835, partial [Planctomycetes bacterium]|nr:hypothetical protein [Planctomycetota bacterium]
TRRWWALVAAGVALGLAVYVRPVGQVMVFVFAAAALLPWGAAADRLRRRLAAAAVFMCVVAAVTGPWVVRNHVRADYCGFSSFATDSLYTYVGPRILAGSRDVSVRAARSELAEEQRLAAASLAARSRLTVGAMARWRARRARQIIAGNLGTCAMMHARGTVGFVLPGATDVLEVAGVTRGQRGTLAVLQSEGMGAAAMHYFGGSVAALVMAGVMLLVPLAKFCGAAVCLFRRARLRMPAWSWLLLAVVVVSAMLGGSTGTPRFRVPVEPVLSVVAAAGLLAIRDAIRFQTTRC